MVGEAYCFIKNRRSVEEFAAFYSRRTKAGAIDTARALVVLGTVNKFLSGTVDAVIVGCRGQALTRLTPSSQFVFATPVPSL
jgi:hypothetical protein